MASDKFFYHINSIIIKLKSPEHLPRNLLRNLRMTMEVVNAPFIRLPADRLPHIVKQHGKTKHLICRNDFHGMDRVHPYVVKMMGIMLLCFHAKIKLWQDH